MVGWLRRKVVNAEELIHGVPAALDAWVRFAGRKTAKPAWAIDATVDAIGHWYQQIRQALDGPTVQAVARRLLRAAGQARVDLHDSTQLAAFMAAWHEDPADQ
jgi:uncharacterized heparinase superfamily protein